MTFIKLIKNQTFDSEIYIKLKNNMSSFIFACKNNLLLNYFECESNTNDNGLIISLGHLFSHELIKFFGTKIEGGLFEVLEVSPTMMIDQHHSFADIVIEENAHARIYGTSADIDRVNKLILDKTILTQINKVTGYPVMANELKVDDVYKVRLLNSIRTLQNRFQFLKCSYEIEDTVLDFYFPEKIVRYFCALVIKNTNVKSFTFNVLLGKIFAELFLNYLCKNAHVFAKTKSVELKYVKEKEFLEFNLESMDPLVKPGDDRKPQDDKMFEFFADVKNKLFIIKLLTTMNFTKELDPGFRRGDNPGRDDNDKPNLSHLSLPFSVELGVTYLNQTEYKNLTEGDIIVFDKTCLSAETINVDKCVINLNGLNLVASLNNDSCQVTHFTKDW